MTDTQTYNLEWLPERDLPDFRSLLSEIPSESSQQLEPEEREAEFFPECPEKGNNQNSKQRLYM